MKHLSEIVMDILRSLPDYKRLSYLELGCGDGLILEKLSDEGANAIGTTFYEKVDDYIRSRDYPEGIRVDGGIDLDKSIPYSDGQFDVVYSMEVVEHIEGHRNFISEAARVLKPGGWFVMTTPNIHRLISRFHFALCGVHLVKERRPPYSVPLKRMGEFHIRCPDFPLLHWLMWQNSLRIEKVEHEYVHPASKALIPFLPLFRLLTGVGLSRYGRSEDEPDDAVDDLKHWMNSRVLLTSERICLLATKVDAFN